MFDPPATDGGQQPLDHLREEIAGLAAQINAAERRRLLLVAELDRRRGCEQKPGSGMGPTSGAVPAQGGPTAANPMRDNLD